MGQARQLIHQTQQGDIMAFFGTSTEADSTKRESTGATETIITSCMEMQGDIRGCGSLYIDGILHGNIETEEGVTVGREGKVFGQITTRHLTVSGTIEGKVVAQEIDVTQSGVVSDNIQTKILRCDGTLKANIQASDAIEITSNGRVETPHMESRHVIISGSVVGNLTATELLEIEQTGRIEGEMTITKIKVAEGGTVLGQMQTYQPAAPKPSTEAVADAATEEKAEGTAS
jgi:cytoskeletal protein CcmA (bactofilin family)